LTLPSPAAAVNPDGGGADEPFPPQPPSNAATIDQINMQYNLFTVEFLGRDDVAVFGVPIINDGADFINALPYSNRNQQISFNNYFRNRIINISQAVMFNLLCISKISPLYNPRYKNMANACFLCLAMGGKLLRCILD
jgi:hypothetical protein